MKSSTVRILLLDLCLPARDEIVKFFLEKGDDIDVITISPNSKNIGDYLLLPDTGGYNCISQAFYPHFPVPPIEIPGQRQWMSHWENHMLEYYVNKNVRMVGFGTSAITIWDKVLSTKDNKGKVTVKDGRLVPIENKGLALMDKETYNFRTDQHFGYPIVPLSVALDDFYAHLSGFSPLQSSDGDEDVPVPVGSGPTDIRAYL